MNKEEYCGKEAPVCFQKRDPFCPAMAIIPTKIVDTMAEVKGLANCVVKVIENNNVYYIDDKHRISLVSSNPTEHNNYDFVNNPLDLRAQIVFDYAGAKVAYYDAAGNLFTLAGAPGSQSAFDVLTGRPKYNGVPMTSNTDIPLVPEEIGTDMLADNAVTSDKISAGAVVADKIADGAVVTSKIVDDAVTSDKLADDAVTADKLASGAVTSGKIANGSITSDKLGNESVTTSAIADGAVTSNKIADGTIDTEKFADSSLTSDKIEDNAVITSKIANSNVTTVKLADEAVSAGKIANGAVTLDKIADDSVSAAKIQANAVTNGKLANGAVTTSKIADDAVSTDKVANASITTNKINDSAVTTDKINNSAVTTDKIDWDTTGVAVEFTPTSAMTSVINHSRLVGGRYLIISLRGNITTSSTAYTSLGDFTLPRPIGYDTGVDFSAQTTDRIRYLYLESVGKLVCATNPAITNIVTRVSGIVYLEGQ